MPNALITGASRGFGRAAANALAEDGWSVILTARTATDLREASDDIPRSRHVVGDIADPAHRRLLADIAQQAGGVDLLVNNAGTLGPSPLPSLESLDLVDLAEVLTINVVAQLAVFQAVVGHLNERAAIVNITSDASMNAYPGWGAYGASKAALDLLSGVLGEERPDLDVYAFDPGDMRTAMHQAAFPGEDISDRPLPETVAPALLRLLAERPASGRVVASDFLTPA